jgi:hypothetical protein
VLVDRPRSSLSGITEPYDLDTGIRRYDRVLVDLRKNPVLPKALEDRTLVATKKTSARKHHVD